MMQWSRMARNILLLTEGQVDEQDIFSGVFNHYGITAIPSRKRIIDLDLGEFVESKLSADKLNVSIIQGPRNRIHDFLKFLKDECVDVERLFGYKYAFFQKIFLLYDVDHNDCDDISDMISLFQDEATGMLLLSSPCIEVLADFDRDRRELKCHHLKEYKAEINKHYNGLTKRYIVDHIDEILLYFLKKNYEDFQESNIMEHPRLIGEKTNELNIRFNSCGEKGSFVVYRYFSTVVYVAIASALSLTTEIDNYETVKSFFESKAREGK